MRTTRQLLTAILVTAFALSACGSTDPGSSATDAVADASDPGDSAPGDADPGDTESSEPDSDAPSGGGIVTVDGVAYTFDVEVCVFQESGFFVVGPGSDPNGNVGYVSVEGSSETDFDLDGQADEEIAVSVEVGAAQMGLGTEDQPYFTVSAFGDALAEQITFERTDNSVSGSGTMTDHNEVAAEFGEPIPFEFEASCA